MMTLLYIDGFEDHTASGSKWSSALPIQTPGRFGSGTSSMGRTPASQYITFPDTTEIVVGFAYQTHAFKDNYWAGVGNSDGVQLSISNNYNTAHLGLVRGGANGAQLITKSGISGGVTSWYYVEYQATLNDSGGTASLWVDGTLVGTYSGDTRNAGTQTVFNRFYIGSDNGWSGVVVDDLYILAVDGTAPNARLGDSSVVTLYPNGNGNSSQGVGSDSNSTDNYLLVDEAGTVVTTDYVDLATGNKDTYTFQDSGLASGATVHGVLVSAYAAKTDSGNALFQAIARSGGTEVNGATNTVPATVSAEYQQVYVTKPGGGAWTQSTVDAAEFGVRAVFSPDSISGLVGWWDAQAITGLSDNDAVSTWTDRTSTRNLTQATGTNQPVYKATSFNGYPCVRFDGSNDFMSATQITSAFTIVWVGLANSSDRYILNNGTSSTGTGLARNSGELRGYVNGITVFGGSSYTAGVKVRAIMRGPGSFSLWKDGVSTGTYSGGQGIPAGSFYVGSLNGSSEFCSGDYAEILMYDSILSDTQVAMLDSYLAIKWGL